MLSSVIEPSRIAAAALVFAHAAVALAQGGSDRESPSEDSLYVSALPTSSLTIRGSTTIGAGWHCTARDITARAELIPAHVFSLGDIRQVFVTVPVWTLKCQSGPMERAMRKAMRAERDTAAAIVGLFWQHEPALPLEPGVGPHLHGSLTVAGVQRDVRLDVHLESHGSDTLHVASALPLTLSGFAITAPRVLFGAVRARDAIEVQVDLRFLARAIRAIRADER